MLNTLNLILSLLFAALVLLALWRGREVRSAPLPRWEKALLWVLILLLTGLRLIKFGSVPGGMNQDGAMAAVDALALSQHGTDRFGTWLPAHFTAWGYGQMSVLLSYCMVPFLRLFGLSALSARLPVLLWSLAGMGAAYAFLRGSLGERAALAGLLFLAVAPWHFMQSRWALDCNLFPHAFLIGFALLYKGREKPWALYLSMLFFALCMYSYGVSFLMVPLFLVLAVWVLRIPGKRVALCVLLYLGISWPIYGTMLINALGGHTVSLPFVTMPYFPASVRWSRGRSCCAISRRSGMSVSGRGRTSSGTRSTASAQSTAARCRCSSTACFSRCATRCGKRSPGRGCCSSTGAARCCSDCW